MYLLLVDDFITSFLTTHVNLQYYYNEFFKNGVKRIMLMCDVNLLCIHVLLLFYNLIYLVN